MQRYFLSKEDYEQNIIHGDDVFHILKVMRGKIGDKIEVCCDSEGYVAQITSVSSTEVCFNKIKKIENLEVKKAKLTLLQGLAKGDKNDEIIKHSAELGVDEIYLLSMKRSIVKFDSSKLDNKLARFNKISKEASEQAHRISVPEVKIINKFNEIDFNNYDLKLLLDEEEAKKIDGLLLRQVDFNNKESILFVIGPEGGIDSSERDYLINNGFICVSVGKNILRTETASLAFLAMINYEFMKAR